MLRLDALRPDTRKLFEIMDNLDGIGDFVLIGGTAMALHHAHRESEDLDFVYVPKDGSVGDKLPLDLTNSIVAELRRCGYKTTSLLDQIQMDLAENDGAYLPDFHQDWAVDGVKLTFFAGDTVDRKRHFRELPVLRSNAVSLLTSDALFETKARLIVQRATTRDLFDLWFFLEHDGRLVEEIVDLALDERPYYGEDAVTHRLTPLKPALTDPGFKPILDGAPKSFDELVGALEAHVDAYQQRLASSVVDESPDGTLTP